MSRTITHARFRGGARYFSFGVMGHATPYDPDACLFRCIALVASQTLTLPDLDDPEVPTGKNLQVYMNFGANTFSLVDQNSLSISVALTTGQTAYVSSFDDAQGGSSGLGRNWLIRVVSALF